MNLEELRSGKPNYITSMALTALSNIVPEGEIFKFLSTYKKVFETPVGVKGDMVEKAPQFAKTIDKLLKMTGEITEIELCELVLTIINVHNQKAEKGMFDQLLAGFNILNMRRN